MTDSKLANSVADLRAHEKSGETYVHNVEIIFPPQLVEEVGYNGLIVPIRRVLEWLASEHAPNDEKRAGELRRIAKKYYPEDDNFVDEDNWPDVDIEVVELLANQVSSSS